MKVIFIVVILGPFILPLDSFYDVGRKPIFRYLNGKINRECKFCNMKTRHRIDRPPSKHSPPAPPGSVLDLFDVPLYAAINRNNGKISKKIVSSDWEQLLESGEDRNPFIKRLLKKIYLHSKDKGKTFTNRILVKRVLPHDAPETGLEYDYRFKTLFKPLVRIHREKTLSHDSGGEREDPSYDNDEQEMKNVHIINIDDEREEPSLEPLGAGQYDGDVHRDTEHKDAKNNRLKSYNKIIYVLKDSLRSPYWGRSLESKDGQQKDGMYEFDEMYSGNKSKQWIPHYPFWNYWTYKKAIHEDVCPEQQVKVGNMCVWFPPH
ncbi:unnamed protein product [Danaus chrysippus]|uniref:(African queen) hypothetical protein n=1 Tax=Danaus chrysippus TaxID=151541 RepID=A0A8J2QVA4_9NEOP|nr:unnamed protein product [Danaus chrysippus]